MNQMEENNRDWIRWVLFELLNRSQTLEDTVERIAVYMSNPKPEEQ